MVKLSIHTVSVNYDTKEVRVLLDQDILCIRQKRSWHVLLKGHELQKINRSDPMFDRLEGIYHALQPYQGGVFV